MNEPQFDLVLTVQVRDRTSYNGGLRVENTFAISADFMDVARILGQFADLADRVKAEQSQ